MFTTKNTYQAGREKLQQKQWARISPCYFHILHYGSSAKYENNMGKLQAGWKCTFLEWQMRALLCDDEIETSIQIQ